MEIKKKIFGTAFLITFFLFISILLLNNAFDKERQQYLDSEVQKMYNQFNEMQTFILMSEIYGDEMACLAFSSKLQELDKTVWALGVKIDQYRVASEQVAKDPYYMEQKKIFNENEVFYLMLLTKLKKICDFDQTVISFFYKNSKDCKDCDKQAFVLTDINKDIDDEVSIFSFDADLGIPAINLLLEYYEIEDFPCIIIEENTFCGLKDKDEVIEKMCELSSQTSLC